MIIVGAKGFAKELLEVLYQKNLGHDLAFYDDISTDTPDKLYDKFPILRNEEQVKQHFEETDNSFSIGVGRPILRQQLYEKFTNWGGTYTSVISNYAEIGSFGVQINSGCNILSGVKISNDVRIGVGGLVYYNSIITHDVVIGKFVEISPNVTLLGRCTIGDFTHIGSGAIVLPDIVIGNNVIVGAGAVVVRNVPDNSIVAGVPAVKIKT